MSHDDMKLVQLVARRYRQLQGLRTAIDGVAMLLLWSLLQIPAANRRPVPYLAVLIAWAILVTWGASRAERFYRERFGRVVGAGADDSRAARVLAIWLAVVVQPVIGFGLPVVIVYAAMVAWQDWPYRPHWLLVVLAGVVLAINFASAMITSDDLGAWQWQFVWTAAPVLAIVGLLDHRLLMRAMHAEALPDTEHADTI